MFNKTKITVVPSGYQPDLDRLPPAKASCGGCLWALILLMLVAGVGVGAYYVLSSPEETPQEPQSSITLNTLVPEATATQTATMDYCWFLTPTLEAMPTIQVTLDTWQIKATDDSFLTGTPTATALPTSEPPKAWCNDVLTMEAQPTATWTPYGGGFATRIPRLDSVSSTITNTPQPIMPTAVPSSTLFPTLIPQVNSVQQPITQPQQEPVIVIQTVVVIEKVKVKDKVTVIVTATPTATFTPTDIPEVTEEPTIPTGTPTIEPTLIPSVTIEATLTPTLTNTPTETATFTATATFTHTPTATLIPTSTLFPTLIPTATDMPTETATETPDNA